nr:50S ribosomal protein L11 methyltransferase [Bacteroidales bacterium]
HRDDVDYEIVIEPKMSFGTAHHPTTRLMIDHLIEEMPVGKKVLDMGTGTGVLAILAKKLGASYVEAVDIDEWSYRNAVENAALNWVDINVRLGDATTLDGSFDMVLANINKNILMRDMAEYDKVLKPGGVLIISGFYEQDRTQMEAYARSLGLTPTLSMTCDDWCSINIFKASDK